MACKRAADEVRAETVFPEGCYRSSTASEDAEAIHHIIAGVTSLRGLAIALYNRGVRTARGGQWQVSNVRNLLARIAASPLL